MVEKETDTLVTNAEQHHRPGMHLADMCVICWAPWPCPTIRLASALTEARAELTALRQDANDAAIALAKAQADSERLDWLERQGCVDLSANRVGQREWCAVHDADRELGRGADMRAAIDAARLSPSPPAPPDEWTTMDAITGPLPTDNT